MTTMKIDKKVKDSLEDFRNANGLADLSDAVALLIHLFLLNKKGGNSK